MILRKIFMHMCVRLRYKSKAEQYTRTTDYLIMEKRKIKWRMLKRGKLEKAKGKSVIVSSRKM